MQLRYALLNIFDFESNTNIESFDNLSIQNEEIEKYIMSYIKKAFSDIRGKEAVFDEESILLKNLNQLKEHHDFESFFNVSEHITKRYFNSLCEANEKGVKDLLVVNFFDEMDEYVAFFLLKSKKAFIHQIGTKDMRTVNDLIEQYSVLPDSGSRSEGYALIKLSDLSITMFESKKKINDEEVQIIRDKVLVSQSKATNKEYIDKVLEITQEVSLEYGVNPVICTNVLKKNISDEFKEEIYDAETEENYMQVQDNISLNAKSLGDQIFQDNEVMKSDFIRKLEEEKLPLEVKLDKKVYNHVAKKHGIKLDNGIEISVPMEYINNDDIIEFHYNEDGSKSILLKNINSIENKN